MCVCVCEIDREGVLGEREKLNVKTHTHRFHNEIVKNKNNVADQYTQYAALHKSALSVRERERITLIRPTRA